MSELSTALVDVLSSVRSPMRPDSLVKVLFCTGIIGPNGDPIPVELITAALNELVLAGRVEKVRRHGSAAYRARDGGSA